MRDMLTAELEFERTRILLREALEIFLRDCEGFRFSKALETRANRYLEGRFPKLADIRCYKRVLNKYEDRHELVVVSYLNERKIEIRIFIGTGPFLKIEEKLWRPHLEPIQNQIQKIQMALKVADSDECIDDLKRFKESIETLKNLKSKYSKCYEILRDEFDYMEKL